MSRSGDAAEMKRVAQRLESDNPLWLVMFGDYSREFVAFPRFTAPQGTVVTAHYPAALPPRMRDVERRIVPVPAASADRAAPSVAVADPTDRPQGQAPPRTYIYGGIAKKQ